MGLYLGRGLLRLNEESRRTALHHWACFFVLLVLALGIYFGVPKHGDIDWPDASRHVLNGAFVLDFLQQLPWRHPVDFAYDYYRQGTALTILFYPSLFYEVFAAVYAVFGVSEAPALLTALGFLLLLALGTFRLSRHWLDPSPSPAVAALPIGAPELVFWGRQIMLDVPAYAFLICAAEFLIRHLKSGQTWALSRRRRLILNTTPSSSISLVYVQAYALFVRGRYCRRPPGALLLPLVGIFFAFFQRLH